MTVKLLRAYGGLAAGDLYDGTADVELELVNAGSATWEQRSSGSSGGPGDSSGGGGGGSGAGLTRLTSAAFDALVGDDALTVDAEYFITDGPDRRVATTTSAYDQLSFVQAGVLYIGGQAVEEQTEVDLAAGTWATRPLTGFTSGVMYYRRMTDIGNARGTVMWWLGGTSTVWSLMYPLRQRLSGAGSVTTSAQYPTNTRFALPAGLMAGCSGFDISLKFDQSDESSTVGVWGIYLGTAGTATDARIGGMGTGTAMSAGDNQKAWRVGYYLASASSVLADSSSAVAAQGWSGSAINSAGDGTVSLTAGDDTSDALYLGIGYTMGTSNTALTTTVVLTLWP